MLDFTQIRELIDQRRPGHSLPRAFYTDPAIFRFDIEQVYATSWIMIGFEVELPQPGSYISLKIGESPIVVIRDRAGTIRGFHNSCRHRGAQICELGKGRASKLVCPYHQWVYDLSGNLQHVERMDETFRYEEHSLKPIRVETAAGAVYACLSEDAPDFEPFRRGIEPLLAPHDLKNAKLVHEAVLVEKANWKLVMENARECYHCLACHPELSVAFPVMTRLKTDDEGHRLGFEKRMTENGLPIGPVEGTWWQAARFPLNKGAVTLSLDGQPSVKKPMVEACGGDVGSMRWALEPHSFAHALGDYVFMFSAIPVGPEETIVIAKWLVHKDAQEGVDYVVDDLIATWNETNLQDRDLAENNQRGVNSVGYQPGPYSKEAESLVIRFVDWYCDTVREITDLHAQPAQPLRRLNAR